MGFSRKIILREWIVFALCLGLGAHVALGFLLHGESGWPTEWYGIYGAIFGLCIYVIVQIGRSFWWVWKGKKTEE
jgi:hypothetical protein